MTGACWPMLMSYTGDWDCCSSSSSSSSSSSGSVVII